MEITVTIPDERLGDFYVALGEFLRSKPVAPLPTPPVTPARPGPIVRSGNVQPSHGPFRSRQWAADDFGPARSVWERCTDTAKAFFSVLIDNAGKQFTGEEIAERIGATRRLGAAGVLSWPSRYCDAVGKNLLWEFGYPQIGSGDPFCRYWMTPERAALFRAVRDQTDR